MSPRPHDPRDVSSHAFWARPPAERDARFAELRREAPVSWHAPAETDLLPDADDPGFWALTRHADVVAASRDAETFASGQAHGGVMLEDVPEDVLEAAHSILAMDAPRHATQRRVISSAFTPRRIRLISDQIRSQARRLVDDVAPRGEIDVVADVASRLPMWTISEMIGIAPEDQEQVAEAANALVGWNDPELVGDGDPMGVLLAGLMTLHTAAFDLIAARRDHARDDLVSALVAAEVEGATLTDEEIASFFVLLCVAGNDTTRQTTSHGLLALQEFPEQRAALVADLEAGTPAAVEELLRWASPVLTFRRTATRDTVVGGQEVAAGEKVVLFYRSANQDEAVFPDPLRLDLARTPNPHLSFGGGGPHFCLGANLARTQLHAVFTELLTRLPDLEVGEPDYLAGNFINGIKRLPARFTPVRG